ncbi:MAG: hypothetical protein JWN09_30 [Microbacteriaceae bacterium]|jgi:hypothetical protein|nr:hypothetical protein [Microbacteriaceae bacterium]
MNDHDPKAGRSRARRLLSNRRTGWIAAVALTAVIGLSGCAATATATSPSTTASPSATAGHGVPGSSGGGSNARSGPAAGGSTGTVSTVSTSGFTLTTSAGQKVTVTEASSTTYQNGTSSTSTSASAITTGTSVLVLGSTNGTTITATQVVVQPTSGSGSTSYSASPVAPFKQGAPSAAKQDGQIPANYTEGSGTIVSGTTADKATEAALAAYPGGVVDRVVKLSSGEYEVHYIGVNWPHHIFVNTSFAVVGAN